MLRFLIFLVGMLSTHRPGRVSAPAVRPDDSFGRAEPPGGSGSPDDGDTWFLPPGRDGRRGRTVSRAPARPDRGHPAGRRR